MTYPGADPALDPDRAAVEQRRKDQEVEFSTYRATQEIPWGNVPAFFTGEVVPKSTVEERGWLELGYVAKIGTKAADAGTPESASEAAKVAATTTSAKAKSGSDS